MKLMMFRLSELNTKKPSLDVPDETVAVATRMDIGDALLHLNKWRIAWNDRNPDGKSAYYSLLSVCDIGELTDEQMLAGNIQLIENLEIIPAVTPEEIT